MALVHAFLAGREKNVVSWHALPTARSTGCVNKTPHVCVTPAGEVQGVRRRCVQMAVAAKVHAITTAHVSVTADTKGKTAQ
jgi:hypothetical protein